MFKKSEQTYRMVIEFTNKNVERMNLNTKEFENLVKVVSELPYNGVLKISGNGAIRFYNMSNINSIKFIKL